ncbi:hypothetical protein Salat_0671200 [Sesamum alatum]|uniref:Uncharacterized protein n=1 Tax=Sesamum alatum TaxID=300844 RepID=A0AAE2CUY6_9LAMI|nr:hypothetical protein Salat_0671200 [Sesamum alatum]
MAILSIVTTIIRFPARYGNDFRHMHPPYFSVSLENDFQTVPTGVATLIMPKVPSPEPLKVPCICFFLELPSPHPCNRASSKQQCHLVWPSRIILFESLLCLSAHGHGGVGYKVPMGKRRDDLLGQRNEEAKQPFHPILMGCNHEALAINVWWKMKGLLQGSRTQAVKRFAVAQRQSRVAT